MTIDRSAQPGDAARVEREAIAWFTRMNGRPTMTEQRDFDHWLAASQSHVMAYQSVVQMLENIGPGGAGFASGGEDLALPLQRIEAHRQKKSRQLAARIVTGGILSAVLGFWIWLEHPNALQNLGADYATARAERARFVLADGSEVLLDADSALDVDFTPGERRVHLLRGSAAFTVRPSDQPFIVAAGKGEARVLGTVFDVSLLGDQQVTVTLASGSLQVTTGGGGVLLSPGQSVSYDNQALRPVEAVDIAERTAWHEGRLIFNDAPLADVLEQIGRYRRGRIVITDAALGARRVSGNISLENADAALQALQTSVGFSLTSIAGRVVIVSR
ncbi:DUF4880 domain-containing protein [Xinfangfangia sp. D13-10-4-6]|uniref:FecR family protein n=1 Tax=Pseudogemmobacter hezensis TaxID=2737662 RepID=UPI001557AF25|nr:FecR domain-containing protein [Pseudogemmobacter hezensis]NPD16065.1 DUF4880 domain-containing protein [Pseudogemmobacter hezensis]